MSQTKSMDKKQTLRDSHPELALEAVGWDPSQFLSGINKKGCFAPLACFKRNQVDSPSALNQNQEISQIFWLRTNQLLKQVF